MYCEFLREIHSIKHFPNLFDRNKVDSVLTAHHLLTPLETAGLAYQSLGNMALTIWCLTNKHSPLLLGAKLDSVRDDPFPSSPVSPDWPRLVLAVPFPLTAAGVGICI